MTFSLFFISLRPMSIFSIFSVDASTWLCMWLSNQQSLNIELYADESRNFFNFFVCCVCESWLRSPLEYRPRWDRAICWMCFASTWPRDLLNLKINLQQFTGCDRDRVSELIVKSLIEMKILLNLNRRRFLGRASICRFSYKYIFCDF